MCKHYGDAKGMVFSIQHFSIHDGSGIRTNVFLKGCPLNCVWCHNPEGVFQDAALAFSTGRCVDCGACFVLCPEVHRMDNGVHMINREACQRCFRCVEFCLGQALEQTGREMTVSEVMDEILRDIRYYRASGGGVTLTGGEPMQQFTFTEAILAACKEEALNTAMETCGMAQTRQYEVIMPLVDTFLFDIKESDPRLHKEYTGADNALILRNLAFLNDNGAKIILRCPIIPKLNDRESHFAYLASLAHQYDGIVGIEMMPYHNLGVSKAERMGLKPQDRFETPAVETVDKWNNMLREWCYDKHA